MRETTANTTIHPMRNLAVRRFLSRRGSGVAQALTVYTLSKAIRARKGRSDFGSWNSTFDHFRSETTLVPSI